MGEQLIRLRSPMLEGRRAEADRAAEGANELERAALAQGSERLVGLAGEAARLFQEMGVEDPDPSHLVGLAGVLVEMADSLPGGRGGPAPSPPSLQAEPVATAAPGV